MWLARYFSSLRLQLKRDRPCLQFAWGPPNGNYVLILELGSHVSGVVVDFCCASRVFPPGTPVFPPQ